MITVLLLLAAIGILVWGYLKAKPFGKLGILAWLQTVVLMGPWLLFFGFSAAGVYLNLAGILLLVVSSAGVYIYLGRQLRELGQAADAKRQRAAALTSQAATDEPATDEPATDELATDESANSQAVKDESSGDELIHDESAIASAPEAITQQAENEASSGSRPDASQLASDADKAVAIAESLPPIPAEDLTVIEGIFGIDTFFRTKTVPYQEGAIFRGNLRGDPGETAAVLSEKLTGKLGDRYRCFLLLDPDDKPVVVVLPSSNGPQPTTKPQRIFAVALAIATFATCLETAGILQSFDVFQSPERWPQALPIALGIIAVLGAHELGHIFMAKKRAVKISPPFFLPAWQLGSFGAITRFESVLPNRSVLFDVSFAGPAAGGGISFLFLFVGLVLSREGSLFQLPGEFFRGSILVGTLARTVLGDAIQADLVDVHPLMVIGWLGLIVTAINVMPAGQLDGGRVVQAIYGRKTLVRATAVTLVLLAIVGLFNPLALYWAVLIVFLQRQPERPCTDDLSEPNDARAALALLALFLMLMVLLPITPTLAARFGLA
ncbi:MAG: site-2 protease family protein [Phormidesmis sp.]